MLPELDFPVVPDGVTPKVLGECENVRDNEHDSDRKRESPAREFATTFGRCEGGCRQDGHPDGQRQRVATLPSEASDTFEL